MIESSVADFIQTYETLMGFVGPAFIVVVFGMAFAISPFSNVLNIITVPLGFEWSSCPHCPAVSVRRIEWAECANCGRRHRTNFGASRYKDGDRWHFCDSDCLGAFTPVADRRGEAE